MNYQIPFAYIPCQTCSAKIHCDECADKTAEALLRLAGVSAAVVDMKNHLATVDCDMDRDDLEACMEDIGMFPD